MKLFSLAIAVLALAVPTSLLMLNSSDELMIERSSHGHAEAHAHTKPPVQRTYAQR